VDAVREADGLTSELQIQLLGDFLLENGGEPLEGVNTPRLQSLLAYLLLHKEAPQSRQHLAFLFWPDSTEAQARTNLRKQIYHLRRALPDADRYLHADSKTVHWRADSPTVLDVAQFEACLAAAQEAEAEGDQNAERKALVQAASLYRGDLLPGSYDDWVLSERERLGLRLTAALERLVLLHELDRQYGAAIKVAQQLLHHDPVHEATHRRIMRLHALNGDRARALRAYHRCATVLERELGIEPSPQTRAAYQRLLATEAQPVPRSERRAPASQLIGRNAQWAQLQAAWRAASRGRPQMVILEGEPGIGKTRLAEELLAWSARQGLPTAGTRCYASEGALAYGTLTAWLRTDSLQRTLPTLDAAWLSEVARLLPELLVQNPEIAPPEPLTESWQQQRFFEALARAFRAPRQLVLLLDNVQWCDQETLEWLLYLLIRQQSGGTRVPRAPRLLVVGTLRSEGKQQNGRLASLLADLHRSQQLIAIQLGPLDEDETASLAESVAGHGLDSALAADLYRETEGNPFFLIETVRSWLQAGEVPAAGQGSGANGRPLPPAVHQAILSRLSRLSPEAREMVGVAAIIGRDFAYPVVARACGCDEVQLVRALDELWQRGIVREQGAESYDFSHDKIREVIYAEMSAARRRLLHRRVAEALELYYIDDLEAVGPQITLHYREAGSPQGAVPRSDGEAVQVNPVRWQAGPGL